VPTILAQHIRSSHYGATATQACTTKVTIRLLDHTGGTPTPGTNAKYVHDCHEARRPRHIRECTGSPDLLGMRQRPQAFSLAALNLAGASREGDAVATHKLAVNQDYYMRNCCNNWSLTISKPGPNPAEQCPRRRNGDWTGHD
jgi:hypothetical protein